MIRYCAFGLLIESEIELPELPKPVAPEAREADLYIRQTVLMHPFPERGAAPTFDFLDPEGVTMVWPQVGGFRICMPNVIDVQAAPQVSKGLIAFPLLGPVVAWYLHLRGELVLHASALAWKGLTIGFLGDKGAGKSTTCAHFINLGADLITDDLLVFRMDEGGPLLQPAFGQIKLIESSPARVTISGAEAMPLVMDGFPKRQFKVPSLQQRASSCDALFILERTVGEPSIAWLNPDEAFLSLMRYSYNVRFQTAPVRMLDRKRHFEQCVELAKNTRVGVLSVPNDLARLNEAVEIVERSLCT